MSPLLSLSQAQNYSSQNNQQRNPLSMNAALMTVFKISTALTATFFSGNSKSNSNGTDAGTFPDRLVLRRKDCVFRQELRH